MLVVAALGGNALLRRGEHPSVANQRRNVVLAAGALARIAAGHRLIVTHGNGPQVGLLALQAASTPESGAVPLDVLGAESEGMIGYLLEQQLTSLLPGTQIATMLTQVLVDERDAAFAHPTKPVGAVYERDTARKLAREHRWSIAPDGKGWRRVVASPEPQSIVEIETIRTLVRAGVLVVCVGGGGIPVRLDSGGALHGVEAVVDKDLSAALLADELDADALLLLTDVARVERYHGTDAASAITVASVGELREMRFEPGSMQPKVEAACRFATGPDRIAAIGSLGEALDVLEGRAGTRVLADEAGSGAVTPA